MLAPVISDLEQLLSFVQGLCKRHFMHNEQLDTRLAYAVLWDL